MMRRVWIAAISLVILSSPVWSGAQDAGWLGVSIADRKDAGVRVVDVQSNSPAEKAGMKANDVILEFNGQPVAGALQLTRMVRETPAGRTVPVRYERDSKAETVQLTIGSAPQTESGIRFESPGIPGVRLPEFGALRDTLTFDFPDVQASMAATQFGVRVDSMTPQLREYFGVPAGEGVLVSSVDARSAAGVAGLKAGDVIVAVNGKRALSPPEVFREFAAGDTVLLKIFRNKQSQEIRFETPATGRSRPGSSLMTVPRENGI